MSTNKQHTLSDILTHSNHTLTVSGHDVRASFAVQYGRLWLADGWTKCNSIIEGGVTFAESTAGVLDSFILTQNVKTGTISQTQLHSGFIYRKCGGVPVTVPKWVYRKKIS